MKTVSTSAAKIAVLNVRETSQSTPDPRTRNSGSSLDLIDASDLTDQQLEELGLAAANDHIGPANRPDPVDIISIGGQQLDVDSIRKEEYRAPVFRGGELDLVA